MATETKIGWCDHTSSPWHGCSKVSPGCDHCYAEAMSHRNPGVLGVWGDEGTRVKSQSFSQNLKLWNARGYREGRVRSVFPSICDPFEDRPELESWRGQMFAAIDGLPWVRLLLLTKRPENVRRMWPVDLFDQRRPNVWLGTSVEDQQRADERITHLLACRDLSPVLFLSCEPLLGPINLSRWIQYQGPEWRFSDDGSQAWPPIDWVIVGGESGPHARSCVIDDVKDIAGQCHDAKVPVFVKQLGSNPTNREGERCPDIRDPKGGEMSEWPEELRVREFPEVPA